MLRLEKSSGQADPVQPKRRANPRNAAILNSGPVESATDRGAEDPDHLPAAKPRVHEDGFDNERSPAGPAGPAQYLQNRANLPDNDKTVQLSRPHQHPGQMDGPHARRPSRAEPHQLPERDRQEDRHARQPGTQLYL